MVIFVHFPPYWCLDVTVHELCPLSLLFFLLVSQAHWRIPRYFLLDSVSSSLPAFLCVVFQTLRFLAEFFLMWSSRWLMFSSNMLGLESNPSAGLHPPSRYPSFFTHKPDVLASHSASFAVSDEVQSLRSYSLLKELCWFNMVLVFLHCNAARPSSYN